MHVEQHAFGQHAVATTEIATHYLCVCVHSNHSDRKLSLTLCVAEHTLDLAFLHKRAVNMSKVSVRLAGIGNAIDS